MSSLQRLYKGFGWTDLETPAALLGNGGKQQPRLGMARCTLLNTATIPVDK